MDIDRNRKVLIYDEESFSRICSALLQMSGCRTDVIGEDRDVAEKISSAEIGVFITSYPYGAFMLTEIRKRRIPAIVLFDTISECLGDKLHTDHNVYCMKKPIDYDKFKNLVRQLLTGARVPREDYILL